MKPRRFPHRSVLALLIGVVLSLAFPRWNLTWLAWLAPGAFLVLAAREPGWRRFRLGVCFGLGLSLSSLSWLLNIPVPLYAWAAWISLSVYLSIFYGAWSWLCGRIRPSLSPLWPIYCGVGWVAMEMILGWWWGGFPWNPLGASQYRLLPLIQIASVTGVVGVSFIVSWFSAACAALFLAKRDGVSINTGSLLGVGVVVFGLFCVTLWGAFRLRLPEHFSGPLRVALIQPAIPQSVIWDANERTNRLRKLVELSTVAAAQHPDLIVWPESALPERMIGRNRETQELITAIVNTNKCWMVFGGIDTEQRGDETLRLNTAFLIDPKGDLVERYFKRRLVVFGEFLPCARWLPFLKSLRKGGAGLEAGRKPVVFEMKEPHARFAPLICYEDVFPRLARDSAEGDVDFLLNLTNNGWFGEGASQWQHAISAIFRAVETGRPLVRCTNNGLTCWVDSRGRLRAAYFPGSPDIYSAGFKIVEIPLQEPTWRTWTMHQHWGDVFGWGCVGMIVLVSGLRRLIPGMREKVNG